MMIRRNFADDSRVPARAMRFPVAALLRASIPESCWCRYWTGVAITFAVMGAIGGGRYRSTGGSFSRRHCHAGLGSRAEPIEIDRGVWFARASAYPRLTRAEWSSHRSWPVGS